MALGATLSVGLVGMVGHVVEVEAHLAAALPAFTLVGLPDAALAESRDRVRAAVASCGLAWPNRRVTVNLSPATLPKSGSGFDLAIAVAALAGAGVVDLERVRGVVHLGELGLDGRLRPVRGILPAVAAAVGGTLVDEHIAYVSAPVAVATPYARCYEVLEELPYREKQLRAALRERGIGRLTIKKRGVEVVPEQLRRRLDLRGEDEATLVLTRVAGQGTALLVRPV